jgi:hypothetical protein
MIRLSPLNDKLQTIIDNMPKVKAMPEEGARKLCLLNDEWIVLEVHCESPTYEETFQPFLYWREPFSDMLDIEWYEVSTWQDLPPEEKQLSMRGTLADPNYNYDKKEYRKGER